jgi:hypothetical protein
MESNSFTFIKYLRMLASPDRRQTRRSCDKPRQDAGSVTEDKVKSIFPSRQRRKPLFDLPNAMSGEGANCILGNGRSGVTLAFSSRSIRVYPQFLAAMLRALWTSAGVAARGTSCNLLLQSR